MTSPTPTNKTATKPAKVTKPEGFSIGKFNFAAHLSAEAPPVDERAQGQNPLHDLITHHAESLMGSTGMRTAVVFIPNSFWTAPIADGGRGLDTKGKAYTDDPRGYIGGKIRDVCNAWSKKGGDRAKITLSRTFRKKGEDIGFGNGKAPEEGFSLFIQHRA